MEAKENKLTNSEIAKVMAMYVPCDTVQGGNNFARRLVAVGGFEDCEFLYGKLKNKASVSAQFVQNFQLLLTPLASVTDEHAFEVGKLNIDSDGFNYLNIGKSITNWLNKKGKNRDVSFEIYSYLISKEYAVPLWFGISHWANGKTAIELEIAVDKTLK